jgi:hypothetical protein
MAAAERVGEGGNAAAPHPETVRGRLSFGSLRYTGCGLGFRVRRGFAGC